MSKFELGAAPIEAEYLMEKMAAMASVIDELLNEGRPGQDRTHGFLLMVFPFGATEGPCRFLSVGADETDVIIPHAPNHRAL